MRKAGLPKVYRVGDAWMTARQVGEMAGLLPNTARWRLDRGWDPKETLERPRYGGRARPGIKGGYRLDGKPVTQKRLAELAGVSATTMSNRLTKKGMTPEDAVAIGNLRKPKP
jgi:hypothetical protein